MIRAGRLEGGVQPHSGKAAPPFISLPISLWRCAGAGGALR